MLLGKIFNTLTSHGALYWAQRLESFFFQDGTVVVLDLEEVDIPNTFDRGGYICTKGVASSRLDETNAIRNALRVGLCTQGHVPEALESQFCPLEYPPKYNVQVSGST